MVRAIERKWDLRLNRAEGVKWGDIRDLMRDNVAEWLRR